MRALITFTNKEEIIKVEISKFNKSLLSIEELETDIKSKATNISTNGLNSYHSEVTWYYQIMWYIDFYFTEETNLKDTYRRTFKADNLLSIIREANEFLKKNDNYFITATSIDSNRIKPRSYR